jgi:hypothetical protein
MRHDASAGEHRRDRDRDPDRRDERPHTPPPATSPPHRLKHLKVIHPASIAATCADG